MSIADAVMPCEEGERTRRNRRRRARSKTAIEALDRVIGIDVIGGGSASHEDYLRTPLELSKPDEENGIGDILCGIFPNPDSNPVKDVKQMRRNL